MRDHIVPRESPEAFVQSGTSVDILLVDPIDGRRETIADLLRECQDVTIHLASNPTSAQSILKRDSTSFDCLVIAEPPSEEQGGRIEEFRSADESIPIIALVDHSTSSGVCSRYLKAGASDCIPVSMDRPGVAFLRERIEFWISVRQLKADAETFGKALAEITEPILVLGKDGRISSASPSAESLLGPDTDDLVGTHIRQIVDSRGDDVPTECVDALRRGRRWEGTLSIETNDGETVPVRASAAPTDSVDSEGVGVLVVHGRVDQDELDRRLRSFQEAVEHAGHVILITDPDGYIEYVNSQFEEVTGYTREEAIGERPSILKSGEHSDAFYESVWETILRGEVWQGELINERKNGERYYIRQTIAPITDQAGSIERFVAVNADISDRKRATAQLQRERDRLEQFARTISHDLRNPLAIALGHTELVAEQIENDEHLEYALSALERMDSMTDQLLTLSKQGETVHDPESVNLGEIVDEAWSFISKTGKSTLQIDEAVEEFTVQADRTRLCELLENLFDNAIAHGGPCVTVEVGLLSSKVGFYVADDGPGFAENEGYRIFESGFTTNEDGTGYGLAIVKQIVEAHGWEIEAGLDRWTGGARFEITTMPLSDNPDPGSLGE